MEKDWDIDGSHLSADEYMIDEEKLADMKIEE